MPFAATFALAMLNANDRASSACVCALWAQTNAINLSHVCHTSHFPIMADCLHLQGGTSSLSPFPPFPLSSVNTVVKCNKCCPQLAKRKFSLEIKLRMKLVYKSKLNPCRPSLTFFIHPSVLLSVRPSFLLSVRVLVS